MTVDIGHLRTSERRSFKTCPQQWQWRYRDELVPKVRRPGALWFGTGVHIALAERYKYRGLRRGRDVLKAWRDYCGENRVQVRALSGAPQESMDELEWLDARTLGEAMLGAYLDEYGKDERWYVLSTEQTFAVPIPCPMCKGLKGCDYCVNGVLVEYDGTFDGVRRDEEYGGIWLWENKTAAQIVLSHLPLDDQAGSYWLVAPDVLRAHGIKLNGTIEGIQYDFLRKSMPDVRPRDENKLVHNKPIKQHYFDAFAEASYPALALATKMDELERLAKERKLTVLGDVSARQPTPNFLRHEVSRTRSERRTQMRRIQNEHQWIQALDDEYLPVIKSPSLRTCGGCDYKQMCELEEQGADWEEYRDLAFTTEDPYADHRKSNEE